MVCKIKRDKLTLEECLLEWVIEKAVTACTPLTSCIHMVYGWKLARNQIVFQDLHFSPAQVAHRIRLAMDGNRRSHKKLFLDA